MTSTSICSWSRSTKSGSGGLLAVEADAAVQDEAPPHGQDVRVVLGGWLGRHGFGWVVHGYGHGGVGGVHVYIITIGDYCYLGGFVEVNCGGVVDRDGLG